MITAWTCPFCDKEIARTDLPYNHEALERRLRSHLTNKHPIRSRLSLKYRRAIRQSARHDSSLRTV